MAIIVEVEQWPIYETLLVPPTLKQVQHVIQKMESNKAPGLTGETMDITKNLSIVKGLDS